MSSHALAVASFVISAGAVVVAGLAVLYTRRQTHATERQTSVAERGFEQATQPLLRFENVEVDRHPDDAGIVVQAWIRNGGRPAFDVRLVARTGGAQVAQSRVPYNIGTGQLQELRVAVPRQHLPVRMDWQVLCEVVATGRIELVATDGEFEARWSPPA